MNLLLMANQGPLGFPNRPDALWVPGLDTQGRNILPSGTENFVTGWSAGAGSPTITITPNQPDPDGGNNAYRIQSSGGSSIGKYYTLRTGLVNPHTTYSAIWCKLLSGNAKWGVGDGSTNKTSATTSWSKITPNPTSCASTNEVLELWTDNIADALDILVYHPQINLGSLCPYSAPTGLPQSLLDRSGHGLSAQNGSTSAGDTNDGAFTGSGLKFDGVDDSCVCSALIPANDFSLIVVGSSSSISTTQDLISQWAAGQEGRLEFGLNASKLSVFIGGATIAQGSTTLSNNTIYCFGITRSGGVLKLKVGANTDATANNSTAIYQTETMLGTYTSGSFLAGIEYLVAIYNKGLSDAEYLRNYNAMKRLLLKLGVTI